MNSSHSANSRRAVYASVGAVAGVVLIPVAAPFVLGLFGFGAAGVIGGKLVFADQLARQHLIPHG